MAATGKQAVNSGHVTYDGPYYIEFDFLGHWIAYPLGKQRDLQDAIKFASGKLLEDPRRHIRVVGRRGIVKWDSEEEQREEPVR